MTATDCLTLDDLDAAAPRGYDAVKRLAQERGCPIPDLLALDRRNDPFFCGSPAQCEQAAWFAGLWQRFGYTTGVHLRRVHYQAFSPHNVRFPSGLLYDNTKEHWESLQAGSRYARYLGLVAPDALIDQRNPKPQLYAVSRTAPEPTVVVYDLDLALPALTFQLDAGTLSPPWVSVDGYDYAGGDQPFHVEVWSEKTTMNDVLVPLCADLRVNLVTGAGYLSITHVVWLLQRGHAAGKPVRLFYISDFDGAGDAMPVQVSRQIEFWRRDYAPAAALRLLPLVLTRDQVDQYDLPNQPSDTGHNAAFEARQGRGVVELDALEALHPGELARIVRAAIEPYQDTSLRRRLLRAEDAARQQLTADWEADTRDLRERLSAVQHAVHPIAEAYTQEAAALAERFAAEVAPYEEDVTAIAAGYREAWERLEADLPDRPEPEVLDDDAVPWLFDSDRDYLTQISAYKRRRGGDTEVRS
jgi:hypothetical protein